MRKRIPRFIGRSWILPLAALASACTADPQGKADPPPAAAAEIVIGLSPFIPETEARAVLEGVFRVILEEVPSGGRVTVFDAYHLKQVTDFTIPPGRAFDQAKARVRYLERNLRAIRSFLGARPAFPGDGGPDGRIQAPQFLDLVAGSRTGDALDSTVVLIGGPLYLDDRDGRFSMAGGRIPKDVDLCVERKDSVFGVADRGGQLRGARVHYAYLGDPWISDVHEAPVRRFWSLFVERQGGELVAFTGDLATVVDRALTPSKGHSAARHHLDCSLQAAAESRTLPPWPGHDLPIPRTPPAARRTTLMIGIRWSCLGCDLDLYSRSAPGAGELFYGNPRTAEGVYFKDYRTSPTPVEGFEWIEYLEPVDLAEVEAAVNFYDGRSPSGVSGEVRVVVGEDVYRKEFEIEASDGNRGARTEGRAGSPHWAVVDVAELVGLSGERRAVVEPPPSEVPAPGGGYPGGLAPEPRAARTRPSGDAVAGRGVRILLPRGDAPIRAHGGTSGPFSHPVEGDVYGFSQSEIGDFGLTVEVDILTDRWYPQGIAIVRDDGTWRLPNGWFGGARHVVRATLKDRDGDAVHSCELNVTVVQ